MDKVFVWIVFLLSMSSSWQLIGVHGGLFPRSMAAVHKYSFVVKSRLFSRCWWTIDGAFNCTMFMQGICRKHFQFGATQLDTQQSCSSKKSWCKLVLTAVRGMDGEESWGRTRTNRMSRSWNQIESWLSSSTNFCTSSMWGWLNCCWCKKKLPEIRWKFSNYKVTANTLQTATTDRHIPQPLTGWVYRRTWTCCRMKCWFNVQERVLNPLWKQTNN